MNENNDLLIQFAILWGHQIGSALSQKEVEIAKEMKLYDSIELYNLFSAWANEYRAQTDIDDSVNFFQIKLTDLLHE